MKKTLLTISLLALGSAAFAEPMVQNMGIIQQSGSYSKNWITRQDTTAKYESITSDGVSIKHVQYKGSGILNVEVGSINAGNGDATIWSTKGDIKLGDVQANRIDISTNEGDITLTGTIEAKDNTSGIHISRDNGAAGGRIILDGATLSNIEIASSLFDESNKRTNAGSIEISGNTTLSNVFLQVDTVNVAEGANLILDNTIFASRGETSPENPDIIPSYSGLTLSDNVTLTFKGDQPIELSSLSIGSGVSFVVELSNEDFADIDGRNISLFDVDGDDIDLTSIKFTFTNADGTEAKSGTITAGSGGSITVTNSYTVAIPEPTTATLSLLALAGLCARRRRK